MKLICIFFGLGRGGCDENTQYIIKIENTPIIAFMGDYQEIFVWLSVSWRPLLLKSQVREKVKKKHMNTDPFWEKFSNSPGVAKAVLQTLSHLLTVNFKLYWSVRINKL